MKSLIGTSALALLAASFATETAATEWNVSLWGKRRAFTEHVEKLAELVDQKTDGAFTLNISYGGLSQNTENLDGISIGAFEMAQFCAGYHEDKNPSITVLELPFLGVSSLDQERDLSMALYQHPAVVEDLARWNATLLMPSPMPQYNIAGSGEAPTTLESFDGLTVRATGGIGDAMSMLGAVPTSMSASEVRQALDSGVVKAVSFAPHAHMSFGVVETADWWTTNLNPGTVNCPVVVNTDALDALTDEEREALLGSVEEALDHYVDYYENETMAKWWPTLEDRGIEEITYDDSAVESFKEMTAGPAATAWIEKNSGTIPAQELYDFVQDKLTDGQS
ncbi:C4-dicarboxylate ABC transporter substrate-binding protein [Qingshengfaniella alkalisoli]|uniref:C4-dicarboxylate ABC transporter substrate-binding protein n=1 Tax=Qingshengfaniella alkalisoli TaxID=2599296 RepID=A0A5B8IAG7_9RHOB|nr:C4-dicarboxylate ABC transporter substrate-binding protein [Qingshengfaniella alkalisoli]QDY71485.1 C4-dicarboxylate ABC transporter substrate-binding protein [Qingshengfaniella alkalisoli]